MKEVVGADLKLLGQGEPLPLVSMSEPAALKVALDPALLHWMRMQEGLAMAQGPTQSWPGLGLVT